jgi:hypothetical protein
MFTEAILAANLTALERAQGQRPAIGPLDRQRVRVVGTPNGPGLELCTPQGEWVALEGPCVTSSNMCLGASLPTQLFIIGPALGTWLDSIENVGHPTRVVVLEPDPGVAALFLARRDWRPLIESKRLRVLVGPQYAGASTCARDVDVAGTPIVLACPRLAEHRPVLVRAADVVARRIISEATSNANARKRFAGRYLLQTLKNLEVIGREADASALDGRFTGRAAVLVAAGPSLDDNLAQLREVQDRAVVIAVDTAVRPLLAAGAKPHLVVAVDPSDTNAAHLAGVTGADDSFLVAEASLHPSAFPTFRGRTFLFRVSNHEPWPWLRTLGVDRGVLRAWGSVLTSAFDLALRMGCDPIVFAGADLAYSHGRPYCRGTIYEKMWADWHRSGSTWDEIWTLLTNPPGVVTISDIRQESVRTTPHLIAFRNWLLEQIAITPGRRFVNATGAGALHGVNLIQMSLQEALTGPVISHDCRATVRAAHRAANIDLSKSASTLAADLRDGRAADLLNRWIAFTAHGVNIDDIGGALAVAAES